MFEDIKRNIEQEKKIVLDMKSIDVFKASDFYASSMGALIEQLRILNDSVPELLKEWSVSDSKKIQESNELVSRIKPRIAVSNKIVKMGYILPKDKEKKLVSISEKDKKKFLESLKLSEESLARVKQIKMKKSGVVKKPNFYAGFSNRAFRSFSERISPSFSDLSKDLKKANINLLLTSYLSMTMMSVVVAFVLGLVVFGLLLMVSLSNWYYFIIPLGLVGLVLAAFYVYPASEANSVDKNISYELPFVTIHMAAIAGSNISPIRIFKIVVKSGEYPNLAAEVQKVIVQVDIYGYDLVTALKNVAKSGSNKRLSELFSGLATNISSGGSLKNYLDKKSENFLVDYRLERQRYSALAGTFMDVYISILIAAPLVLMMLFIIMNVSGLGVGGFGITALMFLSVGAIIITNIIFIVVLNMKQPKV